MSSRYGTTSPCAEIARYLERPQNLVDACMEWQLWARGLRMVQPLHTASYYGAEPEPEQTDVVYEACDEAIDDILAAAREADRVAAENAYP